MWTSLSTSPLTSLTEEEIQASFELDIRVSIQRDEEGSLKEPTTTVLHTHCICTLDFCE